MKIVLCNCPPDAAPTIARAVVEAGVAACVNLIPGVRSIYSWEGEICDDVETTLLIKTSEAQVGALRVALLEAHPYDVPEVVVVDVNDEASHGPYVGWVVEMCTPRA
ncbi:MAG: divalent-cation tolerance protein CutA [Bradymonadia bacterium]